MHIEIYKTSCNNCQNQWYELDGGELEGCPYCHTSAEGAAHVETQIATLEIDPITGTLSFAGSKPA